jgi:hypothetical protein
VLLDARPLCCRCVVGLLFGAVVLTHIQGSLKDHLAQDSDAEILTIVTKGVIWTIPLHHMADSKEILTRDLTVRYDRLSVNHLAVALPRIVIDFLMESSTITTDERNATPRILYGLRIGRQGRDIGTLMIWIISPGVI